MSSALRRKFACLSLLTQTTVSCGVAGTARRQLQAAARRVHRQCGTVSTPANTLRERQCSSSVANSKLRYIHARVVSYSSIPRFVFHAFRGSAARATIGAGGLAYANYKFEQVYRQPPDRICSVQDTAAESFSAASNGLKVITDRVFRVTLPIIEAPQFLKNFFSSPTKRGRSEVELDPDVNSDISKGTHPEEHAPIAAPVTATLSSPLDSDAEIDGSSAPLWEDLDIKVDGFKSSEMLADVAQALDAFSDAERKAQAKKTNCIFELQIKNDAGTESVWTIDMKQEAKVYKGKAKPKADITLIMSDETFVQLAVGNLNGQMAFMTGKLKTKGNVMLATRLGGALEVAMSKAKL